MRITSIAACLFTLISTTARAQDGERKIAVLPMAAIRVDQPIVDILDEILTVEVAKIGAHQVISSNEINAMLGMEKMKTALGCDDVSCATEIGGALGAQLMLTGSVGRLGSALNVSLTLFDTERVEVINRVREKVENDENLYEAAVIVALSELFGVEPPKESLSALSGTATTPPPAAHTNALLDGGWASGARTTGYILAAVTFALTLASDLTFDKGSLDEFQVPTAPLAIAATIVVAIGGPVIYLGGSSARTAPHVVGKPGLRTIAWVAYAGTLVGAAATAAYRISVPAVDQMQMFAIAAGFVGALSFYMFARDAGESYEQATTGEVPVAMAPTMLPLQLRDGKTGLAGGLALHF